MSDHLNLASDDQHILHHLLQEGKVFAIEFSDFTTSAGCRSHHSCGSEYLTWSFPSGDFTSPCVDDAQLQDRFKPIDDNMCVAFVDYYVRLVDLCGSMRVLVSRNKENKNGLRRRIVHFSIEKIYTKKGREI